MKLDAWVAGSVVAAWAMATAGQAAASPASGRWLTPENDGVIEVADCGAGICGAVVTSERLKTQPDTKDALNKDASLRDRPIRGLEIIHEMIGGPEVWKGRVYNPADGGTYSGSLRLVSADRMKLTGCLVWPACKSETWTRLK